MPSYRLWYSQCGTASRYPVKRAPRLSAPSPCSYRCLALYGCRPSYGRPRWEHCSWHWGKSLPDMGLCRRGIEAPVLFTLSTGRLSIVPSFPKPTNVIHTCFPFFRTAIVCASGCLPVASSLARRLIARRVFPFVAWGRNTANWLLWATPSRQVAAEPPPRPPLSFSSPCLPLPRSPLPLRFLLLSPPLSSLLLESEAPFYSRGPWPSASTSWRTMPFLFSMDPDRVLELSIITRPRP